MVRRRLPSLAVAAALALAGLPLQAAPQAPAAHPAIRPFTTAQLATWLCKGLPANDGAKIGAALFDGQVAGEGEADDWSAEVRQGDRTAIRIRYMSLSLLEDVGASVLTLELEGDWHGISEADWVALTRRVPGEVRPDDLRGSRICPPDSKKDGDCHARYEAAPGVRWLQLVWGGNDPSPARWFCPKG